MALIFICIVSILFALSVIWLYCSGGFKVLGVIRFTWLVCGYVSAQNLTEAPLGRLCWEWIRKIKR